MDARSFGGVRASCPGCDRAALARPQGRLHAPSVISAALCLSCIGPLRSVGMRWSNGAAVSCLPLHWCSDRLAAHPRDKDKVVRGDIDEVLLAKATFGVDARGYWLRQIDR